VSWKNTSAVGERGLLAPAEYPAAARRYVEVLEGSAFQEDLARRAVSEWHWGAPQEMDIRTLRCHEHHRATFDIAVRTDRGWHALIGKVFATDQGHVFRAMSTMASAGFGVAAMFSIPQPLAYLPTLRVLLEEKVSGSSGKELLLGGTGDEQGAAMDRAGQWLARFHAAAPPIGTVFDRRPHLEHWAEQVTAGGAGLAERCDLLLRKLAAAAPGPSTTGYRAGHGSYMPGHVLLSSSRTVGIDLDECDVADPGRDVGYFMVACQRIALKQLGALHVFDEVAGRFLSGYAAASGGGAAVAHVPFYRALECLHRARHDIVKRIPARPDWAALMLEEGVRVLS
jgi:aminoglycoside phosphotransferase (APT) family kinase protein